MAAYDAFPSVFLKDQDGEMKEFPAQTGMILLSR